MNRAFVYLVLVSSLWQMTSAFPAEDEIVGLPGLKFEPNFKHYSGYLKVTSERSLFYWLVTSQRNMSTDPLIFWYNGGPGCSSFLGLLSEHGPYLVNRNGSELLQNPSGWNRRASVVYIEGPAGVGFSIAGAENKTWNDDSTSLQNYEGIKKFFEKFPEFRHHDVFIMGESYAGIYLPTLAERIVDGQSDYPIQFKGVAIGNAYLNRSLESDTRQRYNYAHGLIDENAWQRIKKEKCGGNIDDCNLGDLRLSSGFGHGLNPYDIFEKCEDASGEEKRALERFIRTQFLEENPPVQADNLIDYSVLGDHDLTLVCENEYGIDTYLNKREVQKALHVSPAFVGDWTLCGDIAYKNQYKGVEVHIQKVLKAGVPVLLFYGDTDMRCNLLLGSKFAASLGFELDQAAHPWMYKRTVGGFKTIYKNGLTFITVRGAGHMVPQKKGFEILHAIEAFMFRTKI